MGEYDDTLLPETGLTGLNKRQTVASTADLNVEGADDLLEWETMTKFSLPETGPAGCEMMGF